MLRIIYLVLCLINIVNSVKVTVKNEEELNNAFNKYKTSEELEININNVNINILNEISINNNIKTITLKGSSKDSSVLQFNNNDIGFIFNSIPEIKIYHLTISGNLHFIKNRNIVFEDVDLKGILDIYETFDNNIYYSLNNIDKYNTYYSENLNLNIKLNNFNYYAQTNTQKENCINLYGNVVIDNSKFYGNSLCKDSLIKFDGEELNNISITNSNFNGMFFNNCLSIYNAKHSTIKLSTFEKGNASVTGG
ncbi:hypothetical protein PIROE2DRAFT_15380 [Piromyces sp. E2]|nr:hypothetical protein PIROE2DRAFT_15380 [Piromyces sp. E2]|eukprot:OUM59154.1 hypothetical protein PIROE2DRAFT_15380 [Piromyces sp. E2]